MSVGWTINDTNFQKTICINDFYFGDAAFSDVVNRARVTMLQASPVPGELLFHQPPGHVALLHSDAPGSRGINFIFLVG